LDGLGHAFVPGEAALVPELEGEADEVIALCVEKGCYGGGVDSAGHGYGYGFVGRHGCTPSPLKKSQSLRNMEFRSGLRFLAA
jgi:hypothetical protein